MGEISIFNYEIFYLDYLEGRLGEDDIRMLMEFFGEHPECKLDDTELPTLNSLDNVVFSGKSDLKQTEDSEAITTENVDHFMISAAEGILSDEKCVELNQVVEEDANLEKERQRYKAVYFIPDTNVVFEHKEDLKRRRAIVLWPYISAGVAAAIISFIFLLNGDGSDFKQGSVVYPVGDILKPTVPKIDNSNLPVEEKPILVEDNPIEIYNAALAQPLQPQLRNEPVDFGFTALKRKQAHPIQTTFDTRDLEPITAFKEPVPNKVVNDEPKPIFAANEVDERMTNPIEPVTSFITKKTKTEVDFGRKKATNKEKGGFFFKIGKFEISRNKH